MAGAVQQPHVSIVMPARNEANAITPCLETISAQTYPRSLMELIIVDGDSDDRTLEVIEGRSADLPQLTILHNPKRATPISMNLGIGAAKHDVIVRMDAHTTYAPDYIERCVDALESSDADVVGGNMTPVGTTPFGEAVAIATSTPLGVGPGKFHYATQRQYVDTVYLGTFRKDRLVELGGYDESFVIGQDHELNYRITQAGGKILLDPAIKSVYEPRGTLRALAKQYYRYGQSKVRTLRKHGGLPTWRPVAPALLVAVTAASIVAAIWAGPLALVLVALYTLGAIGVGLTLGRSNWWRVTLAVITMQFSYGVGFWRRLLAL